MFSLQSTLNESTEQCLKWKNKMNVIQKNYFSCSTPVRGIALEHHLSLRAVVLTTTIMAIVDKDNDTGCLTFEVMADYYQHIALLPRRSQWNIQSNIPSP